MLTKLFSQLKSKKTLILTVIGMAVLGLGFYLFNSWQKATPEYVRRDAYGLELPGMELLIRVGDKFAGENKERGWLDGQIVDIRPQGFHTGEQDRKRFAVIELPKIEYWELRGSEDWKSMDESVLNLKKYLSVADENGKYPWEEGYDANKKVERIRDWFVDFRWLLDNGYISQKQYFDIYDLEKDPGQIELDFTDLNQILKHEGQDKRGEKLTEGKMRKIARNIKNSLIHSAQAITTGIYTICASGCDYATVTAFEAAIEATLTGDLTGAHQNEETAISSVVTFDMNTNGYKFTLTAASGAEHNGGAYGNGARINYGTYDWIAIDEASAGTLNNFEISKLAVDNSGSGNYGVDIADAGGAGLIDRLLIKGDSDNYMAISVENEFTGNIRISNNIIYGAGGNSFLWGAISIACLSGMSTGDTLEVYNNTVTKSYIGIYLYNFNNDATAIGKNNLMQGNNTDWLVDSGAWDTTAKNVSEDSTSPDDDYDDTDLHTNSVFMDYANNDYRIYSKGNAANLAIVDDGEDLSGTFTDDITGQTRSTWYIGADELVMEDDPWWNTSWTKRRWLVMNNATSSEDLTEFPVMVQIMDEDTSRIDYTNTKDAGEDIRFINYNGTELDYEIEKWDETATSTIWVEIPEVEGATTTQYFYMYYGHNGASSNSSSTAVWNSDYVGVWHMATATDSTTYHNNGVPKNEVISTSDGKIDGAYQFDGDNSANMHSIDIEDDSSLDLTADMTVFVWLKPHGDSTSRRFITKMASANSDGFDFMLWGGQMNVMINSTFDVLAEQTYAQNEWALFAFTKEGTSAVAYKNGVLDKSWGTAPATANTNDTPLKFGHGFTQWSGYWWDGVIDEVRIMNTATSSDWIAAQYESMTDDYLSFGAEETVEITETEIIEAKVKNGILKIRGGTMKINLLDDFGKISYAKPERVVWICN